MDVITTSIIYKGKDNKKTDLVSYFSYIKQPWLEPLMFLMHGQKCVPF